MKRRLLIIAIFLLLGAVVNVVVVWECTAFIDPFRGEGIVQEPVYYFAWKRPGVILLFDGPALEPMHVIEAGGWPLICAGYHYDYAWRRSTVGPKGAGPIHGGIQLPLAPWSSGITAFEADAFPRALPLRPLWPGFAVNTLFYGTLLWLLICGPFALRRFLRVRGGLCPACAHPIGESAVCTECGGALAKDSGLGDR